MSSQNLNDLTAINKVFFNDLQQNQSEKQMFVRIKNLSSSYETVLISNLLIYTIDLCSQFESSDFSELSAVIMKIYFQLISIVKWSIKQFVRLSHENVKIRSDNDYKKMKNIQKKLSPTCDQKQFYKIRQNQAFIADMIEKELSKMNLQYSKENDDISCYNIEKKKQTIQKINPTGRQNLMAQAIEHMNSQSEILKQFISTNNNKFKQNTLQMNFKPYQKLKQETEESVLNKCKVFSQRLTSLMVEHVEKIVKKYNLIRKPDTRQLAIEAKIRSESQQKLQRQIKILQHEIQELKVDRNYYMERVSSLQSLFKEKTTQIEKQLYKIRVEKRESHLTKALQPIRKSMAKLTSLSCIDTERQKLKIQGSQDDEQEIKSRQSNQTERQMNGRESFVSKESIKREARSNKKRNRIKFKSIQRQHPYQQVKSINYARASKNMISNGEGVSLKTIEKNCTICRQVEMVVCESKRNSIERSSYPRNRSFLMNQSERLLKNIHNSQKFKICTKIVDLLILNSQGLVRKDTFLMIKGIISQKVSVNAFLSTPRGQSKDREDQKQSSSKVLKALKGSIENKNAQNRMTQSSGTQFGQLFTAKKTVRSGYHMPVPLGEKSAFVKIGQSTQKSGDNKTIQNSFQMIPFQNFTKIKRDYNSLAQKKRGSKLFSAKLKDDSSKLRKIQFNYEDMLNLYFNEEAAKSAEMVYRVSEYNSLTLTTRQNIKENTKYYILLQKLSSFLLHLSKQTCYNYHTIARAKAFLVFPYSSIKNPTQAYDEQISLATKIQIIRQICQLHNACKTHFVFCEHLKKFIHKLTIK